ncbi:MAG: hypothetical protein ACYC6C_05990, partial [Coriobacteriia bacterium]
GVLKLPNIGTIPGHKQAEITYSCYLCHGDDFSASNSVNVHNPAAGESRGGIPCYTCHTVYQTRMEDGLGVALGIDRTSSYHHVLGDGTTAQGDRVTYPTLTGQGRDKVFCLSCHVDHDKFSPLVSGTLLRSANLRAAYSDAGVTAANSDFSAATGGVCLGCHSIELARDNTDQKPEANSTRTPPITSTAYDASAHQYIATSSFTDASTFNADCVKCHDSEIDGGGMESGKSTTGFQTSTNKFSVHYSSARRVLGTLGVTIVDPPAEENTCYACHSLNTSGFKAVANRDWYDRVNMSAVSQGIYALMGKTYKHNVGGYSGIHRTSPTDETQAYISANKHVECADCHGVHAATATRHTTGTNLVSGTLTGASGVSATYPTGASTNNYTGPTGYTAVASATKEHEICFKCHSGANTNYASWGGTGAQAWTNVALDFSPNNGSYHPVVSALPATDPSTTYGSNRLDSAQMRTAGTAGGQAVGGYTVGNTMYCSDCHMADDAASLGPHGSAVKWMLRGPNRAWPYSTAAANGTNGDANWKTPGSRGTDGTTDGLFCLNCHALTGTVHSTSGHSTVACAGCHVRVPHGAKTSRLLQVFNNSSGSFPYTMPARLTARGDGQQTSTLGGNIITHAYKDSWAAGSCTMAGTGCGGDHSNTNTTTDARW